MLGAPRAAWGSAAVPMASPEAAGSRLESGWQEVSAPGRPFFSAVVGCERVVQGLPGSVRLSARKRFFTGRGGHGTGSSRAAGARTMPSERGRGAVWALCSLAAHSLVLPQVYSALQWIHFTMAMLRYNGRAPARREMVYPGPEHVPIPTCALFCQCYRFQLHHHLRHLSKCGAIPRGKDYKSQNTRVERVLQGSLSPTPDCSPYSLHAELLAPCTSWFFSG